MGYGISDGFLVSCFTQIPTQGSIQSGPVFLARREESLEL